MVDNLNRAKRSWNMSRIRSKNTRPEMIVRKALHAAGFRFRLHVKALPGKPDIVLPKWKAVIFVHGCFWHRHEGCKKTTTPKTRTDWWLEKFSRNVANDHRKQQELKELGWRVLIVWACEIDDLELLKNKIVTKDNSEACGS